MVYSLQQEYIYGPVNSRRLGRSLGVNLLPWSRKICPLDCVYCHYGDTDVVERGSDIETSHFPRIQTVLDEVESVLVELHETSDVPDYITFSGSGRYGVAGQFPTNLDSGPAHRYAAGTFKFIGQSTESAYFTLDVHPAGATVLSQTGAFNWTAPAIPGAHLVTVRVQDGG